MDVSPGGISVEEIPNALWYEDGAWEEAEIPFRPWLAVGYLLRGSVTAVVGPGGVSKSSLMLAWAVHLALGIKCHAMRPLSSYRVMLYNVEDDAHEQRRRLSAVLTSIGKAPADIAGKIARVGPSSVGTLIGRDEEGLQVDTGAFAELERRIVAFKPDVLILDPLAELHVSEENDNTALRSVIARFRALAVKYNLALALLHHTRKGVVTPGDADAVRGASSIASAARVVLTVVGMSEEEEKAFGLPTGARKAYFRLDGGKSNYAGLTDAEWFERVSFTLGNGGALGFGDTVAVTVPWQPPADVCTPNIMAAVEAGIARGHAQGPWSPQLGNTPRSVKHLMVEFWDHHQAWSKGPADSPVQVWL